MERETGRVPVQNYKIWYWVGLLLGVSFGVKLIWNLDIPFVEPVLLLTFPLWILRRGRAPLRRPEWLLFLAFVLSATLALRHPQLTPARWIDAWSHTFRMLGVLLLLALTRSLREKEILGLCRGAWHSMVLSLALSIVVASIGLHLIPNVLRVDFGFVDYQDRFVLRVGEVRLPRLFGLFSEPAPFGAFGVQCFVLFQSCRNRISKRLVRQGTIASILVITASFSDQAWLAMLILLAFRSAHDQRRVKFRRYATASLAVLALGPYLFSRLAGKATELSSYSTGDVWGSSGAERIMNSVFALGIASQNTLNLLFGVGPSLFGIFMGQYFPVLGDRQQVQVLFPDLLCSIGIVGFSVAVWVGWRWLKSAQLRGTAVYLFAILLAVIFQSDFKSPSLGVAIGICLAQPMVVPLASSRRRYRLWPRFTYFPKTQATTSRSLSCTT